jgi:hypothetical protein
LCLQWLRAGSLEKWQEEEFLLPDLYIVRHTIDKGPAKLQGMLSLAVFLSVTFFPEISLFGFHSK